MGCVRAAAAMSQWRGADYSLIRAMCNWREIPLGRNSSHEDSSHELTPSEWSDWSEEGNLPAGCRGIVNPNYPGFQHLAPSLLSDTDLTEDESCDYTRLNDIDARPAENDNEYNNNVEDSINHLCGQRNERKIFYEKPKFNIQVNNIVFSIVGLGFFFFLFGYVILHLMMCRLVSRICSSLYKEEDYRPKDNVFGDFYEYCELYEHCSMEE